MNNRHHITRSAANKFYFDVQLNWLEAKKGILSAHDARGPIYVAMPRQFGGEGQEWSPEHLFLASLSSCFMTTYLVFAQKFGFTPLHIECEASGLIELTDGKYRFTQTDLFPKITVTEEAAVAKAEKALEKTEKYCLVSNSINCPPAYHAEVIWKPVEQDKAANNTTVDKTAV